MKKLIFVCACILMTGLMFNSCGPDDATLQGKAKAAMVINYSGVNPNVRNAVATLSGIVESEEDKAGAEKLIAEIDGIKSVVNEITVQAPPAVPTPDESLKAAVSVALADAGFKDVGIEVKDEEVTLTGTVKKADQTKILDIMKGIKTNKVINQMK